MILSIDPSSEITCLVVFGQVRHKPSSEAIGARERLEILDLEVRVINYVEVKNKGADHQPVRLSA